ncbi:MAG: PBP1A family penicillin-binding protein [Acidobacteria bacterium]|nr:PBP1A family penicillin-binding protein [Acidobacteriota bacterium]
MKLFDRRFTVKLVIWMSSGALLAVLLGIGLASYILYRGASYDDLNTLRSHEPKMFTRIYDRHGNLIDIISSEKRILLEYEDIPVDFVNALVALEDQDFFEHIGVSPLGIMSAIKDNLISGSRRGASTLTQQLVKNITKDTRDTYSRKLKEQFLAVQLESMFTKGEIFAMYANEVPLGNQQFGIEAAARFYFGKSVGALNLEECATLAGIPQAPSRLNPYRNPDACTRKRNLTLTRMYEEGYIKREQMEAAKKEPLVLVERNNAQARPVAAHFVDKVREYLFQTYGEEVVRSSGWDVHTTLSLDHQEFAERAVVTGLKEVDKRGGYRPWDCPSIFKGATATQDDILNQYFDPSWHTPLQDGVELRGVVMSVTAEKAVVRIRDRMFEVGLDQVSWTRQKDLTHVFKQGDVPLFRVSGIENGKDEAAKVVSQDLDDAVAEDGELLPAVPLELVLEQDPVIEGAFLALDPQNGDIICMVGGYDYNRSKFNRAEQAKRQVGSAFKPVIFGAALEQGFTLSDKLFDEPTMFVDPSLFTVDDFGTVRPRTRSAAEERAIRLGLKPAPEVYEPHNYYLQYAGNITLRQALAQSKNIVAVKLLNSVGYDHVIEYAYRLGLDDAGLQPYPSMALGAFEMSLLDMCAVYSAFAKEGIQFEPRFITLIVDRRGQIIEQNLPRGEQVVSPENAYLVTSAMQSVVNEPRGTAHRASRLGIPLAGKTGTTDDYTDAWFVGYHPTLVAGAWVGHNNKETIGRNANGANTALPIWISYFEAIKDKLPEADFRKPDGVIELAIDKNTGTRLTNDCECTKDAQILEIYRKGTEPVDICQPEEQREATLPWFLQKKIYEYDPMLGRVKPSLVMIDYASQQRALAFLNGESASTN